MSDYLIDSYAWMEYLSGSQEGQTLMTLIRDDSARLHTCVVSVAEVASKLKRRGQNPEEARRVINANSVVINVDEALSYKAGLIHAEMRLSQPDIGLADAYILALAAESGAVIVSGDPHFKGVKNVLFLS